MKQTIEIEIEVPDGHKAVYNEDTQRVIIIKVEKPKVELPKSWEEFCKNNPVKKNECFIFEGKVNKVSTGWERDTKHKDILPSEETAEAFLALMQLIQLRDCYRQGWKPDWTKRNDKYCILHINDGVGIEIRNYTSSVLSFQSAEIRDEFRRNFRDLIEQAKELI